MLGRWHTHSEKSDHSSLMMEKNKLIEISDSLIKVHVTNYMLFHDPPGHQMELPTHTVAGITILCILTVIMVMANILSICTIATNHILRQSSYYTFVLGLAIIDLLIGAFIMPIYIIWMYNNLWPFDTVACDIVTAIDIAFSAISTYTLVLVALDKYIYITQPFMYQEKLTVNRARLLIVAIWITWLTFGFVSMYGNIAVDKKAKSRFRDPCIFIMNDIYNITTACVVFVVPFIILTYTGIKIYCIAHLHLRKIYRSHPVSSINDRAIELQNYQDQAADNKPDESLESIQSVTQSTNRSSDISIKSEKVRSRASFCKPFGTVVIIIVFFLIMCAPYWIATGSDIFCHCVAPWIYEDILAVVHNLNSLVNPFIYILTDRRYRTAVKKLLVRYYNTLFKSKQTTLNRPSVQESKT